MEWGKKLKRTLIFVLFTALGVLLVGLILNSSKLAVTLGERDRLSEAGLTLIKNNLEDTATFLGKLSTGPGGPGDNQLSDMTWINNEALLVKHSNLYSIYDEAPGFRKIGFSFSEPLSELQLVLYNLNERMAKYHYQLSPEDRNRSGELARAVHDLAEEVTNLAGVAYQTDGVALQKLNVYKQKANVVYNLARALIEQLKKE